MKIKEMKINGKEIQEAKLNGQVVYRKNIADVIPPEAEVTYSNNNGLSLTKDDVTVTLTANEPIKDIEGWTRVNETTFTKIYSKNGKYSVEIKDIAGNKSTINYEVKRIDKNPPNINIKTGVTETIGNAEDGYTLISFKLSDDNGLKEWELNGVVSAISNSKWGDINNVSLSTRGAIEGSNTLIVRDRLDNSTTIKFKLVPYFLKNIEIGDNLLNTILYTSFPSDFSNFVEQKVIMCETNYLAIQVSKVEDGKGYIYIESNCVRFSTDEQKWYNNAILFDNTSTEIKNNTEIYMKTNDGIDSMIVSEINKENSAYQYIKIKK